jgi:hypothetical protein
MAHETIRLLILTLHDLFFRFPPTADAPADRARALPPAVRTFLQTAVGDCIVAFGDALHSLALAPHHQVATTTDADAVRSPPSLIHAHTDTQTVTLAHTCVYTCMHAPT